MRIYKTIKPTYVFTSPVKKEQMMTLIKKCTRTVSNKHVSNALTFVKDGETYVRAYNFEKHNRKVLRLAGDVYRENGGKHVLTPMYWVVQIYDIPIKMLEFMNLHLVQNSRHFDIVEL